MLTNKLSLAVLLATLSSIALTGCGGSSSSSSSDNADGTGNGNDTPQNQDDTPVALTTYTDLSWSVGSDELVGLTYPQGAQNGPLVALKRSTASDSSVTHTLMLAQSATKEFTAVDGLTLSSNYYRDVLALPVSGTFEGTEVSTVLIATCGYAEASLLEGGTEPEPESSAMAVALEPTPAETVDPATLEIYLPGTDVSYSTDFEDNGESLIDCHSMGGLSVFDTASKGGSSYSVNFYVSGQKNDGKFGLFEVSVEYDYSQNEITEAEVYEEDNMSFFFTAVEVDPEDDYFFTINVEGNTYLLDDFESKSTVLEFNGNPFTADTSEGADILDLVYSGDDLFAVSADAGLVGADFTGKAYVLLSGGDFTHCADQLAVNGTTLWCHDSTDEGKLIEFTAPDVPQSQAPEVVAVSQRSVNKVSKEEAEQIKAELEGAGAEVEVK
ncbi:ribosomal protein L7/L12 [Thalassolituus marinus]|uniref:Ribosomal protein L7/L12 n=1 Tax=Thalassolituus marinus TaxID=671053 RepID=A0ABS7ZKG3_9GAMM|nr:ribosomal protein L7/L12 [Thalassolituus marinus]MCA6062188.1 ribosomal protein L7/L12 [Thalassolituus marinus]